MRWLFVVDGILCSFDALAVHCSIILCREILRGKIFGYFIRMMRIFYSNVSHKRFESFSSFSCNLLVEASKDSNLLCETFEYNNRIIRIK